MLIFKLHVLHTRNENTTREIQTVLSFVILWSPCLHYLIPMLSPCSIMEMFNELGIAVWSSDNFNRVSQWLFIHLFIRFFWNNYLNFPRRLTFSNLLHQSWNIVHKACDLFFFSTWIIECVTAFGLALVSSELTNVMSWFLRQLCIRATSKSVKKVVCRRARGLNFFCYCGDAFCIFNLKR